MALIYLRQVRKTKIKNFEALCRCCFSAKFNCGCFLGKYSDCSFLVGSTDNQQTLACHKIILAIASPVFEAMFFGMAGSYEVLHEKSHL